MSPTQPDSANLTLGDAINQADTQYEDPSEHNLSWNIPVRDDGNYLRVLLVRYARCPNKGCAEEYHA